MGDASLKFLYRTCGWAFGLGYNVYGRSTEKVALLEDLCYTPQFLQTSAVAVKGYTGVGGQYDPDLVQPGYCISKLTPDTIITSETMSSSTALSDADLNLVGAPRQIQHTVFADLNYQWEDCENQPFAGIGGSCSFAQNGKCDVCTANQWSLWIHGGLTF
jgi:hypothetical protein